MAKKKSLKMKNYMNHKATTGALENAILEWQVPDDISIVGVLVWCEHSSTVGGIRIAEVSLAGTFACDVSTADIEEESDKKVLVYTGDKNYAGDASSYMAPVPFAYVWFGKELSVDVDENDIVYVHQYGSAAGTGMTRVIIYYIER